MRDDAAALWVLWARKNSRAAWVPVTEGPRDRLRSFLPLIHGETQILPVGQHPAGLSEK
jgi:hypothetical protein